MRVKEILNKYELCLADIEVILNGIARKLEYTCNLKYQYDTY